MVSTSSDPASTLKVKYKSATADDFMAQHGRDVSREGIFVKTKKPLRLGALLRFEFQLQGGSPVLAGLGRVVWSRTHETATLAPGMGIRFVDLEPPSRTFVERIVRGRGATASRFDEDAEAERAVPAPARASTAQAAPASPVPPAPVGLAPAPPSPVPHAPSPEPAAPAPARVSPPERAPQPPAAARPRIPPLASTKDDALAPPAGTPRRIPPLAPPGDRASPRRIPSLPQPSAGRGGGGFDADLFSDSNLFDTGLGSAAQTARTSFFPEISAPKSAAARESEVLQSSDFLATALSEGGADTETTAEARAEADQVRRASTLPPETHDPVAQLREDLFSDVPQVMPASANSRPDLAADLELRASFASPVTPPASTPLSLSDTAAALEDVDQEEETNEMSVSGERSAAGLRLDADEYGEADLSGGSSTVPVPPPDPAALLATSSRPPAPRSGRPSGPPATARTVALPVAVGVLALAGAGFFVWQGLHTTEAPQESVRVSAVPGAERGSPPRPGNGAGTVATGPVRVEVTSLPRGAEARVDGKLVGATPTRVEVERGKKVTLVVASPGYASATKELGPDLDGLPVHFDLAPLPYVLVVETEPAGGDLTALGATSVSPAPLQLGHVTGSFTVTAGKEGYLRTTRPVRLSEFTEQDGVMRATIRLNLSPLPVPEPAPKSRARPHRPKPLAAPTATPSASPAPATPAQAPKPAPSAPPSNPF